MQLFPETLRQETPVGNNGYSTLVLAQLTITIIFYRDSPSWCLHNLLRTAENEPVVPVLCHGVQKGKQHLFGEKMSMWSPTQRYTLSCNYRMDKDGQTDKGGHESKKKGLPCKDRDTLASMAVLGNKSVNMRQAIILCPTKHSE